MNLWILPTACGVAFLAGCFNAAAVSSGHVGCDPAAIVISGEARPDLNTHTWMASCRGKEFYCSAWTYGVSCAPAAAQASEAPARSNDKQAVPRCCLDHSLPCGGCPGG
jgi:hypothetical protein